MLFTTITLIETCDWTEKKKTYTIFRVAREFIWFVHYCEKWKCAFPANPWIIVCYSAVVCVNLLQWFTKINVPKLCQTTQNIRFVYLPNERRKREKQRTRSAATSHKYHAKSSKFVKNTHRSLTVIAGVGKSIKMRNTARRHKAYHCKECSESVKKPTNGKTRMKNEQIAKALSLQHQRTAYNLSIVWLGAYITFYDVVCKHNFISSVGKISMLVANEFLEWWYCVKGKIQNGTLKIQREFINLSYIKELPVLINCGRKL